MVALHCSYGAGDGTRTRKGFPPAVFKTAAFAFSPLRLSEKTFLASYYTTIQEQRCNDGRCAQGFSTPHPWPLSRAAEEGCGATTDVARRVFQPLTPGPSPALRERGVVQRRMLLVGFFNPSPPAPLPRCGRGVWCNDGCPSAHGNGRRQTTQLARMMCADTPTDGFQPPILLTLHASRQLHGWERIWKSLN